MKTDMTYLSPDKQIPIMVDSNKEMFTAMQKDKVTMPDLETAWLNLFKQTEAYDAKHLVQCQRMLFESSLAALHEFTRKDFTERQREKELNRELSYEDAAAYLDCSVSTIKRFVSQGKLNPKKYNSKVVKITVGDIEHFRSTALKEKGTPVAPEALVK